jgi:hypothetical protein
MHSLKITKTVGTKSTYDLIALHRQITYGLFVPEKRKKLSGGSERRRGRNASR